MATAPSPLETRLAELLMAQLSPCDLGDGIEVVHDVEAVEIEMECDVDDAPVVEIDPGLEDLANTIKFARQVDDGSTHQYVRYSAPYDRIELVADGNAFVRATIEEAQSLIRSRS
jgi:hypothetical protein